MAAQSTLVDLCPDLREILDQLDALDDDVRTLLAGLTDARLNWQPEGGRAWSIAQNLDHLTLTNTIYTRALSAAVERALSKPQAGLRRPIQPGWLSRWFLRTLEPPPRRKFRAPALVAPSKTRAGAEVLAAFLDTHEAIRRFIHDCGHLDLNRIRFQNPFLKVMRLTVGTGLLVMPAHDRRHLWQARQVRQSSAFPRA